jgi:hypothetical protein
MKGQSKFNLYGYNLTVDWVENEEGKKVPTKIVTDGTAEMAILNLDMEVTDILNEEDV